MRTGLRLAVILQCRSGTMCGEAGQEDKIIILCRVTPWPLKKVISTNRRKIIVQRKRKKPNLLEYKMTGLEIQIRSQTPLTLII